MEMGMERRWLLVLCLGLLFCVGLVTGDAGVEDVGVGGDKVAPLIKEIERLKGQVGGLESRLEKKEAHLGVVEKELTVLKEQRTDGDEKEALSKLEKELKEAHLGVVEKELKPTPERLPEARRAISLPTSAVEKTKAFEEVWPAISELVRKPTTLTGEMDQGTSREETQSDGISQSRADFHRSKPILPGFAVIVMGVAASGKSTVGELLSKSVRCPFIDADDFHTEENKEKMRNGIPLTEDDRLPWLVNLRNELANYTCKGEWVVMACSALRPQYRSILLSADQSNEVQETVIGDYLDGTMKSELSGSAWHTGRIVFAYLKGPVELFASRLEARYREGKHFMPPSLLKSQMDLLETNESDHNIIPVDASLSPGDIVDSITRKLSLRVQRCIPVT